MTNRVPTGVVRLYLENVTREPGAVVTIAKVEVDDQIHWTQGKDEIEALQAAADVVSLVRDQCKNASDRRHCWCRPENKFGNKGGKSCCRCEQWTAKEKTK